MGSINVLTNYQKYYGLPENGASSTGIVFAIFNVNNDQSFKSFTNVSYIS